MPYTDHFHLVDDVTAHFDSAVASADAFIQSRYVGFYSIAAAAVVEIAVKEIVITFATEESQLFGNYVEAKYGQINGRVQLDALIGMHLAPFGDRYQGRFKQLLNRVEQLELRRHRYSIKTSYSNLLQCRNMFAHEGSVPVSSTYSDVKLGFGAAKIVLRCLSKALSNR